jgi:hypothetical protein
MRHSIIYSSIFNPFHWLTQVDSEWKFTYPFENESSPTPSSKSETIHISRCGSETSGTPRSQGEISTNHFHRRHNFHFKLYKKAHVKFHFKWKASIPGTENGAQQEVVNTILGCLDVYLMSCTSVKLHLSLPVCETQVKKQIKPSVEKKVK